MGFPENMLVDDERVVLSLHPHWKRLVGAAIATVLIVGLAIFGAVVSPWMILTYIIAGIAVLLLILYPLRRFLSWVTTRYVFTSHRILLRRGILSRSGRDIPLDRINDVSFQHNLLERMLGCGTLIIESAGEHGQLTLRDIPHVEATHSTLYELVEAEDDPRRSAPSGY